MKEKFLKLFLYFWISQIKKEIEYALADKNQYKVRLFVLINQMQLPHFFIYLHAQVYRKDTIYTFLTKYDKYQILGMFLITRLVVQSFHVLLADFKSGDDTDSSEKMEREADEENLLKVFEIVFVLKKGI